MVGIESSICQRWAGKCGRGWLGVRCTAELMTFATPIAPARAPLEEAVAVAVAVAVAAGPAAIAVAKEVATVDAKGDFVVLGAPAAASHSKVSETA